MSRIDGKSKATAAAKKKPNKYKKAPQAPKRFKSAFIFFSSAKHPEIRKQLGEKGGTEKTTNVAKLVSEAWKGLSAEDREEWEEKARQDKARYEVEKTMYAGPWKVPATKRTPKDPDAPKRPMSAFLAYSNSKRAGLKRKDPSLSNADVSRILSKAWRAAPEEERKRYIDQEFKLRQEYKVAIEAWRVQSEKKKEAERQQRQEIAKNALALQDQEQQLQQQLQSQKGSEQDQSPLYGSSNLGHFGQGAASSVSSSAAAMSHYGQTASIQGYPFGQYDGSASLSSMETHNRQGSVASQFGVGSSGMPFLQGAAGFSSAGGLPSVYDATLLAAMQNQQQQGRAGMGGLGGAGAGLDAFQNSLMQAQMAGYPSGGNAQKDDQSFQFPGMPGMGNLPPS
eukprot:CAMPEP_0195291192 /NCGR_PEP_ID=MMETSP0707-20130614/7331_1 /TAXON_ID=33640 /ORGANISM="Asterionellopsis glacialis, Strain CCMP134" /LENGTH=394 /DNA_ID=CAMNT_0040351459 /DNA_START=180 /DNA_END=1364 /DNA_ORIENTATION=+